MKSNTLPSLVRLIGRTLFGVSLLLYLLTLSTGFFAGQSASLLASHLGLQPFPPMVNHVWGWMVSLFAAIPIGPMAVRVNLLGAVCSAASVWLLFHIMMRLTYSETFKQRIPLKTSERSQLFAAVVASLALMTAIPFWVVATRAHPLAFDLMLLLLSFHLLLRYGENGRTSYINGATLVYAVGLNDFATLILFFPMFVLLALYELYRFQELRVSVIFRLIGIALVGLVPQFIAAALYAKSAAFEWRQFTHYGQVLWWMWHDQYMIVTRSVPRVGWLTVGVVSVVPWLAVYILGIGRRSASAGSWLGTALMCALLSALSGVILTNGLVSPWTITRGNPPLVTPYVLIAMWTGAMAGYWLASLQRVGKGLWHNMGYGFIAIVIVAFGYLGYQNISTASGRPGGWFSRFADETLDRMGGRPMLISSGSFDDVLLLEARARGESLKLINLRSAAQLPYRLYVASLFPENARLRSLAEIGVQPFLLEWFSTDTNMADQVAVLDVADLWMSAGLLPEPNGLLYLGRPADARENLENVAENNRAFWAQFVKPLSKALPTEGSPAFVWLRALVAQSAKAANNLGVFFEDHEDAKLAEEAYKEAIEISPENVSALVNLHALYQRQKRPEAEEAEKKIEAIISLDKVRQNLWSLSYNYGTIRSPELYARRGWAWAMSGKPALAAQDLRAAIDIGGENNALRIALAALDEDGKIADVPENVLQAELASDPQNVGVAMDLYRLAVQRGQFDVARGRLEEVKKMKDAPQDILQFESTLLDSLAGDNEKAAIRLAEIVRKNPENLRAWAALAVVAGQQDDSKTVQEALDHLQQAKRAAPSIRFMAAQLALRQGDRAGAKRQLEEILRVVPNHAPALALLLQVQMMAGDRENAEKTVERLIAVDPQNTFGNYMLGSFQALRGQYALAESSFRTSLARQRTPAVMNDLAYVLARQKQYPEALSLIEECIRMSDDKGVAWSTYGLILLQLNRLDEAETALQNALAENPDSAETQLNLAELFARKGQKAEALKLAESITSRSTELLQDDQEALRDLLRRLRSGS